MLGGDWTKTGVKAERRVALPSVAFLELLFSRRHDFLVRGERHIISVQTCQGRLIMFENLLPVRRGF
jgi:hypothetical protein